MSKIKKQFLDFEIYEQSEVDTISGSLSNEIDSDISTHSASGDHDGRYYTETESDANLVTFSGTIDHNTITNYEVGEHRTIDDVGSGSTDLWSAEKITAELSSISGTSSDHSDLDNLDYASAGHTGFQPAGDYATDAELTTLSGNLQTNIDGKADTIHTHDDRYYTETEVDTISGSLSNEIDADISTHSSDTTSVHGITDTSDLGLKSGNVNQFNDITSAGADIEDAVTKKHAESHTITSHSDIVDATGANIEELTGGGDTALHDHDGISENTNARHDESHTITSHSDITDATGANIEELTGGGNTTLHLHGDTYYTETETNTWRNSVTQTEMGYLHGIDSDIQAQLNGKDNYASWSFAVDGVTKDAITSSDVLDFVGGDDITITRSAEDKITIAGSGGGDSYASYFKHNLVIKNNATNPDYQMDIDIDAIVLDTGSATYLAKAVNLTVDMTSSGANGLDTGEEAGSTMYYLWVIYNGSVVAGLISTSNSSPTMPSGYTYKCLVGEIYNNASDNFLKINRQDDDVWFEDPQAVFTDHTLTTSFVQHSLPSCVPSGCCKLFFESSTATATNNLQVLSPDSTTRFEVSVGAYTAGSSNQGPTGGYSSV